MKMNSYLGVINNLLSGNYISPFSKKIISLPIEEIVIERSIENLNFNFTSKLINKKNLVISGESSFRAFGDKVLKSLKYNNLDFDIVIVGLGPTGGTLANLLAMNNVSVLILEKEANIYKLPRAVHFDDEIMRVFQTIGITKSLSKKLIINKGTKFIDDNGELLLDWPRPKKITENGWYPSYRFHQPDLERSLRHN